MPYSHLKLAETPNDTTESDWMALVTSSLKETAFDTLTRQTDDGLARGPLSTAAHRPETVSRLTRMPAPLQDTRHWHISAPLRDPEIAHANQQALDDLEGGASALRLSLGRNGVQVHTVNDVKRLFDRINTDLIPITLAPSMMNGDYAAILKASNLFGTAHISLGLSPFAQRICGEETSTPYTFADILAHIPPHWRAFTLAGSVLHDVGATEAQELAFLAAGIAELMRTYGPEQAAQHILLEIAVDQDGHLGIAKLRAARRICAQITESFGLSDTPLPIHVVTSRRMMQTQDPWTNMLRIMAAGFGAVCGGADYITTRPFTDGPAPNDPRHATPFGHRIARNMQLMMMEESHLGQVQDAAYGSYFHERMTEQLAQAAWTEFQAIESAGGIEAVIESGVFKAAIETAAQDKASKERPILGVTLHPAPDLREAKLRTPPKIAQSKAQPMDATSFAEALQQAKDGRAAR